ncbi:HAD-IIB family hydrolase [uncultured Arcanobacterium sp.]|uniref:HAD-IIB family hydrolase n=1 Tax=uncultured Arcanobacterium sp. TaxID=487520 RepID=UPI00262C22CB|nr:HAD-IIB family hydrolase [uncultured Arcanobacterium sp.]
MESEEPMENYALLAFDLDDTLAPSKSSLPPRMGEELKKLLMDTPVCVISGGNFAQFRTQLLAGLESVGAKLENLHIMPTCGTRYLRYRKGKWETLYARDLPLELREKTKRVLEEEAKQLGLWEAETWGPILEDRGSQITFSALGQQAPLEAKKAWDPNGEKKEALRERVARRLPELEVRSGGSTSIDVTQKGVDKAYGIAALAEETGIAISQMLFIGDRLDEGGNDYPVKRLGIATYAVKGWEETADFIAKYTAR